MNFSWKKQLLTYFLRNKVGEASARLWLVYVLVAFTLLAADHKVLSQDIVLSDFEELNYAWLPGGVWAASGNCFGSGPAQGTLAGQNPVDGYLGHGLVNTFLNGDSCTGTLTSPPFTFSASISKFSFAAATTRDKTAWNWWVGGK